MLKALLHNFVTLKEAFYKISWVVVSEVNGQLHVNAPEAVVEPDSSLVLPVEIWSPS